jgi:hypothetical protein
MHSDSRYAVAMPDADDLREALAEQLDAMPVDRWPAFLRDASALFRRQQYDDQRVDWETFTRTWGELIADAQRQIRGRR